jgi:hypothetical protein
LDIVELKIASPPMMHNSKNGDSLNFVFTSLSSFMVVSLPFAKGYSPGGTNGRDTEGFIYPTEFSRYRGMQSI